MWPKMPLDLNRALQTRLKEQGLSFHDVPLLPKLIKLFLRGKLSLELFRAQFGQIFRRKVTKIPRKGARGGYEYVPTPQDQMDRLFEDILAVVESAKLARSSKGA